MEVSETPVGSRYGPSDAHIQAGTPESRDRAAQGTRHSPRPLVWLRGNAPSAAASTDESRFSLPERARTAVVVIASLLFIALLGLMFYVIINPSTATIRAEAGGENYWKVEWILPAGPFYERGVRQGDKIVQLDGVNISSFAAPPADFTGHKTVTIEFKSGERSGAIPLSGNDDNPVRRWTFTFVGLIFMGVGGLVFLKARQRTAASAFYVFCIATAASLALAMGVVSNIRWVQASLYVSLAVFASFFAYFFFEFPVRVGKDSRQHATILAALLTGGLLTIGGYIWVSLGHVAAYDWVRVVMFMYLTVCVGAGLLNPLRLMLTNRSPEIRQRLVLLVGGTAFAVGPTLLLSVVPLMLFDREIVSSYVTAAALGIMPLAFAYAITQHELLGIRGFVRRSVVYVVMGSSVLLVFSLAATGLSAIVPNGWERNEFGLIGFSFFVFLIAFSFGHLQRRVEHMVDKFIYHDAYDYKEALLQFSSQLAIEQEMNVLAGQLVERTCRLMNLVCGVLVLAIYPDDESATPQAQYGAAPTVPFVPADDPTFAAVLGLPVSGPPANWMPQGIDKHTLPVTGTHTQAKGQILGYNDRDYIHVASPSDPGKTMCLEVRARYGEDAGRMIDGLRDELFRMGVDLYEPRTGSSAGARGGHPSLVEAHAGTPTGSLGDAVSNAEVTEIFPTTPMSDVVRSGEPDLARSFLGVPLWTRSRFVGVLCLAGKKTGERFSKDDLSLLNTLGSQAALAIYNAQLYEAREQALLDTIAALAHAIEAKDGYTSEHCEKMTDRAVAVAQELGMPRQEIENVRLGAMLHDVGKIGIPDAVLNKSARLTPEEYEIIKQHSRIGAGIVSTVKALKGVVPIVMHHQEHYDGSGYPAGLSGDAIPMGARIIGVVDTYGAMTEDRVYRKAPGHDRAVTELRMLAGRQFDPAVVDAFLDLLERRPEIGEHTQDMSQAS